MQLVKGGVTPRKLKDNQYPFTAMSTGTWTIRNGEEEIKVDYLELNYDKHPIQIAAQSCSIMQIQQSDGSFKDLWGLLEQHGLSTDIHPVPTPVQGVLTVATEKISKTEERKVLSLAGITIQQLAGQQAAPQTTAPPVQ